MSSPLGGPTGGGFCGDGSQPNPATGLCANGQAPTTIPIAQSPYQQTGQPCTGQDSYTGQPCACYPPSTSSAMMMYGQMSAYQPSTPTCNCSMCGQMGGYGQQPSPYGQSPYGTSPYGQSPYGTQSPYGSPYGQPPSPYGQQPGLGIGGIGTGLYPPGYPSYPYGPIGANYSPYPSYPYPPTSLGGYPGISPIGYPSPIISPIAIPYGGGGVFGGGGGFFGAPGTGGGGGGGGGNPGSGFRHAFQGTTDLNGYVGSAIARDAYGF